MIFSARTTGLDGLAERLAAHLPPARIAAARDAAAARAAGTPAQPPDPWRLPEVVDAEADASAPDMDDTGAEPNGIGAAHGSLLEGGAP